MNDRSRHTFFLIFLVASVANPLTAAPDPLPSASPSSPDAPVSPSVAPTPAEAYPAAIQTLLDRGVGWPGAGWWAICPSG